MDRNNTINGREDDEIEIDLVEVFGVLLSKIWVIIGSAVLAALAVFLITTYFVTPKYESTTKIYVINRQNSDSLTYSDLQSGTQLTKDYQALVTSRPVLEEVRAELALDIDDDTLESMITVEVPTDTRIVSMTVEDEDPYVARAIADRLRISASQHIADVMNTEAVNVVEEANLPTSPSSPKILKDSAIGGFIGAFIAIAVILIIYITDDTIKNPDDVEKYLHVSVLGSIPVMEEESENKKGKRKKSASSDSHAHTVQMKKSDGVHKKTVGEKDDGDKPDEDASLKTEEAKDDNNTEKAEKNEDWKYSKAEVDSLAKVKQNLSGKESGK